jgi:hypothetical protein
MYPTKLSVSEGAGASKPHERIRKTKLTLAARYAAGNREAAEIVLSDPEKYGGPESCLVRWAHMVLDGYEATRPAYRRVA